MFAARKKPLFSQLHSPVNGADRPVVIVGLGETGLSCARHLAQAGKPFVITDNRDEPPALPRLKAMLPDARLALGGFDVRLLDTARQLIVSPGVSLSEPFVTAARNRNIPVLGDTELFARLVDAPVAAVTGSNGKSTVTTMLQHVLQRAGRRVAAGGNLGRPALDLLNDEGVEFYLLELSSFQLERTHSLKPDVAAVLNLSPDHMDRYPDLAAYAAAKARIFTGARQVVFNRDDAAVAAMVGEHVPSTSFGADAPAAGHYGLVSDGGETWLARGEQRLMGVDELRVQGRHNWLNALAALAMAEALDVAIAHALEALRKFPGLPHRVEWIAEAGGVTWINDSKGTNVGASTAAIRGMKGHLVLIAGGEGKGADFGPLAHALRGKARGAVLIGRDAPRLERALTGICPTHRATDMPDAVAQADALAQPGDTVLLSPACASLDMFRSYEERGDAFRDAVKEWLA